MRKVSSTLLMLLLILGSAMAQQTEKRKALYLRVDQNVPLAVLKEVERQHPGLQLQEESVSVSHKKDAKSQAVKPLNRQELNKTYLVYTLAESETGIRSRKRAEYSATGDLISSREIIINMKVPKLVLMTMGRAYSGWVLKGTRTLITEEKGNRRVFYVLKLVNGKEKKRLLLNEEGQIVKNKKVTTDNTLRAGRQKGKAPLSKY